MSNTFGSKLKVTIFGQSHSPAMGACLDGLPAGFCPDMDALNRFMQRRAPGRAAYATPRKEADVPEVVCGLSEGQTCGAPLTVLIRNTNARSADYEPLRDVPRPSHADFAAYAKYGTARDFCGGGQFSGRLTAPLCAAGGICLQVLKQKNILIAAHIAQIGDIYDTPFDPAGVSAEDFHAFSQRDFPVMDEKAGARMRALIQAAKDDGDSVGGVVECAVIGVPPGLGEPMFNGMENRLAAVLFGIPAIKGVEFGGGFSAAALRGSQNNDDFCVSGQDIRTRTNHHGGLLGGITSGMPIVFRVAFKPTPSIAKTQASVSLSRKQAVELNIVGRHDPCIVPRAVPCVEAAAAIAVLDAVLEGR